MILAVTVLLGCAVLIVVYAVVVVFDARQSTKSKLLSAPDDKT